MPNTHESLQEKSEFERFISPQVQKASMLLVRVGDHIREKYWRKDALDVKEKESHHSIVTSADKISQDLLKEGLAAIFPQSVIIVEEEDKSANQRGETLSRALSEGMLILTLDPIDGTSFFEAGLPDWSISAAGIEEGRATWGIIYAPAHRNGGEHGELYVAEIGKGAYFDGKRMHRSQKTDFKRNIGNIAHRHLRTRADYDQFGQELLLNMQSLWTTGSTAYILANIAAGRLGFAIHPEQSFWDFAAAIPMLGETGGKLTDLEGRSDQFDMSGARVPRNTIIAAKNEYIYDIVLKHINGT
jgi:myo-inositol-1(or 4)-monophosphatase